MDKSMFKVQVILSDLVKEIFVHRFDPAYICFNKFKENVLQRYDILRKFPFKMAWIGK